MYVCVCNAVTERDIHQAVEEGATSVKHLKKSLGVSADCGSCASCAKACLQSAKNKQAAPSASLSEMVGTKLIQISPIRLGAG